MRKLIAIFIAIFLLQLSTPLLSFAKEKDKTEHKSRKQRKAEKRQKKQWARINSRANDYRYKDKHLGENKFEKQTAAEKRKRKKHHLKP